MMKIFFKKIFTLIIVCGIFHCVTGIPRILRCTTPTLPHGNVKTMKRGVIRFTCDTGFTLIGNKYATCEQRKWDTEVPYCVKAGCPKIHTPEHGMVLMDNRYIARLFCTVNYETAGNLAAYCDGVSWDRTLGMCRQTGIDQDWCDFETKNLCGWQTESTEQFQWTQRNGNSAYQQMRNAPLHDHTTKISVEGHYMLLESVNNNYEGQTYLISPVFKENPTMQTCFRFYYHKTGNMGILNVYVKPIAVELNLVISEPKYKYVEITNLNNTLQWRRIIFVIKEKYHMNFQIVIEGKNVMTPREHLAIDDVAYIYDDEECKNEQIIETTEKPEDEDEVQFETLSCVNRCNETKLNERIANIIRCDCANGCDIAKTCCIDYLSVCINTNDTTDIDNDGSISSSTATIDTDITGDLGYNYGIVHTSTMTASMEPTTNSTLKSTKYTIYDIEKILYGLKNEQKHQEIEGKDDGKHEISNDIPMTKIRTRNNGKLSTIGFPFFIDKTILDNNAGTRKEINILPNATGDINTGKGKIIQTTSLLTIFIIGIFITIIILLLLLIIYKYKYKIISFINYYNVKKIYNRNNNKNKNNNKRNRRSSSMDICDFSNRNSICSNISDGIFDDACNSEEYNNVYRGRNYYNNNNNNDSLNNFSSIIPPTNDFGAIYDCIINKNNNGNNNGNNNDNNIYNRKFIDNYNNNNNDDNYDGDNDNTTIVDMNTINFKKLNKKKYSTGIDGDGDDANKNKYNYGGGGGGSFSGVGRRRGGGGNAAVAAATAVDEYSDIRYLTADNDDDEDTLDFTLGTPDSI